MKIVAIVSGGLDSVCHTLANAKGNEIYAMSFTYGQKGKKELEVAKQVLAPYVKEHKILDISFMKELWVGTQLTDDTVKVENSYTPSVVVPIRNMVFLTIGLAYAYSINADLVTYGSHLNDVALAPDGEFLYPDCHPNAALAIETAAKIAHFRKAKTVRITSPGIEGLTKVSNLQKAYKVVGDVICQSWSCYNSLDSQCGTCESCNNRKDAFKAAGVKDTTKYLA